MGLGIGDLNLDGNPEIFASVGHAARELGFAQLFTASSANIQCATEAARAPVMLLIRRSAKLQSIWLLP